MSLSATRRAPARAAERSRALQAGELAWLAALPCAAVVLATILVLGPALGSALFPSRPLHFWRSAMPEVRPEPTEQARYLVALAAPVLLAAAIVAGTRLRVRMRPATIHALVLAVQVAGVAFLVACLLVQRSAVFGRMYTSVGTSPRTVYFTAPTLAAALVLAGLICAGARAASIRVRCSAAARETRARRVAGVAVAVAAVAIWMLPALNFEDTVLGAHDFVGYHLEFTLDETYAVLNGRAPLVDFAAQYGSLWPYPVAALMGLLGGSVGVYTGALATISALALLSMLGVLRRIVRSTLVAVLLFLPWMATSLFTMSGPSENRYALANLYGAFPLRYAGPLLLLWLLSRHLDGGWPRRPWTLFLVAGLVVMNNGDFGIPALAATVATLLLPRERRDLRGVGRLARDGAIGLAAAFALVSVVTLAWAGALPDLSMVFRYARLFAVAGFGMLPVKPAIGVSSLIFLTYVAALGLATVRVLHDAPDRHLTGLLVWSGIFGLGIGSYYVGRSHPEVLMNMFPAWAFSLVLLAVVVLRSIAAHPARWPAPAQLATLFGLGVLVCSLAQVPLPWAQVERLGTSSPLVFASPRGQEFVAARTQPGEPVAILLLLGHRIGANLGVTDVTPYTGAQSMPAREQLDETLDELRAAGGHKVFLWLGETSPQLVLALRRSGFARVAWDAQGMAEFAD